jgi:hypothetical protein
VEVMIELSNTEKKKSIEKNILPSKIKWHTVGPQQSRVDGSVERS